MSQEVLPPGSLHTAVLPSLATPPRALCSVVLVILL